MPGFRFSVRFSACFAARCAAHLVALGIFLAFSSPTTAQTTYRWIDKTTGQTIFSDKPPPAGAKLLEARDGPAASDNRQMPYATRQAAAKYPVVLYTSANCAEICANARALLNDRGVPFAENLLKTEEEIAAVSKQMGSDSFIPGLKVGSQSFAGYESGAWNNLLDLAGYPKTAPYGAKRSGVFSQ